MPPGNEEFEALAAGDPVATLAGRLAPHIVGMQEAKQALIMSLASGDDTKKERLRCHALLIGPPGTSKTSLLRAAASEVGNTLYGPRMSTGGITVDFRSGKVGVIGAVHETPYQVLALDEIEKFDPDTLDQLLVAMETGTVPYAGGGNMGSIPAHVRVIAACNDETKLSQELLDRFDYKVHIPLPSRWEAHKVVQGITSGYLEPVAEGPSSFEIRPFLDWARGNQPKFSRDEKRMTDLIFGMLVDSEDEDKVRLRPYHGMLRSAHALARLTRSDLTAELVLQSVKMLHPTWKPYKWGHIESLLAFRRQLAAKRALDAT